MFERITDKNELRDIVWDDHLDYETVTTVMVSEDRWHDRVATVFKRVADGKLFIVRLQRAATELQEHGYPDEAVEAEAYIEPVTKYRVKKI